MENQVTATEEVKQPERLKVKVRSMQWEGRDIDNQFEISTPDGRYFQSYQSVIVFIDNEGQVWLDEIYWDYSPTTSKWRNRFLGRDTKEIKARIKSGQYKFASLN